MFCSRLQHLHLQWKCSQRESPRRDFVSAVRRRKMVKTLLRLWRRQHLDAHLHRSVLRLSEQHILLQVSTSVVEIFTNYKPERCPLVISVLFRFTLPSKKIFANYKLKCCSLLFAYGYSQLDICLATYVPLTRYWFQRHLYGNCSIERLKLGKQSLRDDSVHTCFLGNVV